MTHLALLDTWVIFNKLTLDYIAPEVMCRQNHSFEVDYFAVGVIGYEFMMGKRPYNGKSRKEIRDNIFAKQV
jgi:serine/threonine protein kinase